jgi:cell division transport system permease protein
MRATFIASEIGIGLRRNLTMTIAVIVTTTVSLFFFGVGMWLNAQIGAMKGYWYDKVEVSVFLCGEDSTAPTCAAGEPAQAEKDEIQQTIQALPQVEQVFYESKQEAYDRFSDQFEDSDLAENIEPEQMPDSFRVKLVDPEEYRVISETVGERPGVEVVEDSRETLESLFEVLSRVQLAGFIVAGAQLAAAALMISNTIQVAAHSRRRETGIMRLVGASSFIIQLPFLLEGAIAGLTGGLLAVGGLALAQRYVVDGWFVENFRFTAFIGWDEVWMISIWVVALGVALSVLASFLTLWRYLRV